MEKLYASWN